MPKREDIKKVLIIGSGPIIIGQACEFDYSGTQACKALRALGYEIVLANSNPATIMTDPETADAVYIEPLNVERLTQIIEKERPDALLPNLGGQSGLNLSSALAEAGVLEKYGVEVIGTPIDAIERGEDRDIFKQTMEELGIEMARSRVAHTVEEAVEIADELGYPCVLRPAYTMGGTGGGLVYNVEELRTVVARGLAASPVSEVLVEESILGWEELEFEVVRDAKGQMITVCTIENIDPMGVPLRDDRVNGLFLGTETLGLVDDRFRGDKGSLGIPEFGTKFTMQMLEDGRILLWNQNAAVIRNPDPAAKGAQDMAGVSLEEATGGKDRSYFAI